MVSSSSLRRAGPHGHRVRPRATLRSMRDTTLAAEEVRLAAVRRLPPAERLRQVFELSEAVRRLVLAGLRERHPERTDVELIEMLVGGRLVPAVTRPTRS